MMRYPVTGKPAEADETAATDAARSSNISNDSRIVPGDQQSARSERA
jgi:hypothetical protein